MLHRLLLNDLYFHAGCVFLVILLLVHDSFKDSKQKPVQPCVPQRPFDVAETTPSPLENDDVLFKINNFSFVINPEICRQYSHNFLAVNMVSSKPDHEAYRNVIRAMWNHSSYVKGVFLLGLSDDTGLKKRIRMESKTYRDILMGNFRDHYRNMTYKHIMGLKWVSKHCSNARYIIKTDDDVVVDFKLLANFFTRILSPWGTNRLVLCPRIVKGLSVQRKRCSSEVTYPGNEKWTHNIVTTDEYRNDIFPDFCKGYFLIYSQDALQPLLKASRAVPYVYLDDVYVTGLLPPIAGIPVTSLRTFPPPWDRNPFVVGYELEVCYMEKLWNVTLL
ncbi:beta-1,3-galactosyltransferase 5 [Plutella xylostella]|uniref:beta-1,3-galactosyltransferase 5 n=1 Tax=Plutella xylostella TaxID=51655 RepID=UPI002032E2BC|nr:beta-1,3-galactosyltransferase 5 [Plutella xylostella]XP_048488702.1 beta-1,3-galactosyltransferase 5 [Plutella xylostella]